MTQYDLQRVYFSFLQTFMFASTTFNGAFLDACVYLLFGYM